MDCTDNMVVLFIILVMKLDLSGIIMIQPGISRAVCYTEERERESSVTGNDGEGGNVGWLVLCDS